MTTKTQKIRVGLFAAITAALIVVVVVSFAGIRFWESRDEYRIVFNGSVMGLQEGAHVFLNGIRVGTVENIDVAPEDLRKVVVKIKLRQNTPVHTDTQAMLQLAGITGLKVIDLRDGTLASPRLAKGGTIAQGETILDKLEEQAKTLADQTVELMSRANEMMARSSQIIENLVAVTDPQKFQGMEEIVAQAKITAANLAAASNLLKGMVTENRTALRSSIAAVEETARNASAMLDGKVAGLVTNAGSFMARLDNLVSANEGAVRSAVFDLRQASRSFKELAREVRQKPSRLFFSSAPSERKLP
ncbi:MAG: MlaD family protein [Myxococcota bacterium]|nr:MlaD family protein [Myxococcota bacterium]